MPHSVTSYDVGVYYFPNYHIDPRNEAVHGSGWTEWELVKRAVPRFPGHAQPRVPLWGYEDEADPTVFARKIDVAAENGITHFLFDWYYYNDGPFLQRALEQGYWNAPNNHRLRFALMWANHDWTNIHPARYRGPHPFLYPGKITAETFDRMTGSIIERYFTHPGYQKIDGCPYFSLYEVDTFVSGLGGTEKAREALARFRAKTRAAGFPDLHLNAVVWGQSLLPGEQALLHPKQALRLLGFDSFTSYVWIHHVALPDFPVTAYDYVLEKSEVYWRQARKDFSLPYFPNVTMGWDSSPRTLPSDRFENVGYPFMPVLGGNTPQRFKEALRRCRRFLEEEPKGPRLLNINAWNEWTEGSYLEPDTVHGMAYLEAIKEVFGPAGA